MTTSGFLRRRKRSCFLFAASLVTLFTAMAVGGSAVRAGDWSIQSRLSEKLDLR